MFKKLRRKLKKRWDAYTPFERCVSGINLCSAGMAVLFSVLCGVRVNRVSAGGLCFCVFVFALTYAVQLRKKNKAGAVMAVLCALGLLFVLLDTIVRR